MSMSMQKSFSKVIMRNKTLIFTLLLTFALIPQQTSGRCLRYGHSCWGGHGKRSNMAPISPPDEAAWSSPEVDWQKLSPSDRVYALLAPRNRLNPVMTPVRVTEGIPNGRDVIREPQELWRKMMDLLENQDENEMDFSR